MAKSLKLDFSGKILDAKGNEGRDTLGELLANLLMTSSAKPPISAKYFAWGIELVRDGILEVDKVDKDELIKFIEESDQLTVLGRHRLLEVFDGKGPAGGVTTQSAPGKGGGGLPPDPTHPNP